MTLPACEHDPVPAFTPVLTAMPAAGIGLGDVLAGSGYSFRVPGRRAVPLRAGAQLVQDLNPRPQGHPRGRHRREREPVLPGHAPHPAGTRPPGPGADKDKTAAHDAKTSEAARYKLGIHATDGYCRVQCPALAGKIRCPLRPASTLLDRDRPEIWQPPGHPQACCTQATLTVPPPQSLRC